MTIEFDRLLAYIRSLAEKGPSMPHQAEQKNEIGNALFKSQISLDEARFLYQYANGLHKHSPVPVGFVEFRLFLDEHLPINEKPCGFGQRRSLSFSRGKTEGVFHGVEAWKHPDSRFFFERLDGFSQSIGDVIKAWPAMDKEQRLQKTYPFTLLSPSEFVSMVFDGFAGGQDEIHVQTAIPIRSLGYVESPYWLATDFVHGWDIPRSWEEELHGRRSFSGNIVIWSNLEKRSRFAPTNTSPCHFESTQSFAKLRRLMSRALYTDTPHGPIATSSRETEEREILMASAALCKERILPTLSPNALELSKAIALQASPFRHALSFFRQEDVFGIYAIPSVYQPAGEDVIFCTTVQNSGEVALELAQPGNDRHRVQTRVARLRFHPGL